ncbi:MAG: helix-turn-helix transcriptional regulator [Erysipelotrichaceae bacterium]|nr:helix-turn-helix transcriptional regulator [Erysipelotrichaceae bacterium]
MLKYTFEEHLKESMKDPEFRREWEKLQPEMAAIETIIKAREEMGISQEKLSELTGIDQAVISKLETGKRKPTLKMLQRLAHGLGKIVQIEIV